MFLVVFMIFTTVSLFFNLMSSMEILIFVSILLIYFVFIYLIFYKKFSNRVLSFYYFLLILILFSHSLKYLIIDQFL